MGGTFSVFTRYVDVKKRDERRLKTSPGEFELCCNVRFKMYQDDGVKRKRDIV